MRVQVVDYTAENAAQQFVESLHETGFGVLTNHPIQQHLVESIYKNWYEFFATEEKHDFAFDPTKQDGYFAPDISEVAKGFTKKDLKEYYHVYPWGRVPAQLEEEIRTYYKMASDSSKYTEALSNMIMDTPNTLLRILHYPPLSGEEEEGAVRAAAHEDINLLTILPAANAPGLQVQEKDGNWIDVPANFGNLIINIGDMLQEASGGYFPSTSHRVINPTGEEAKKSRISLPLFLHPRDEVVLSERYSARGYLDERLRELGVK